MNAVRIALLGDFNKDYEPHYKVAPALNAFRNEFTFTTDWIPTTLLETEADIVLRNYDVIWAGSGPYISEDGILKGIRYAREHNIPFLGTCSGFQYSILEFTQNQLGVENVKHPRKLDIDLENSVLVKISCNIDMHPISFRVYQNTLAKKVYQSKTDIIEISHCTYGINPSFIDTFENHGMVVSAADREGEAKIIEYKKNDFFMAMLFLPQVNADSNKKHPVIEAILKAGKAKLNLNEKSKV